MSSIIYIEPNERNRLVKIWKEHIFSLDEKLHDLKTKAENIREEELVNDIKRSIKNLRKEFGVVFSGASNNTIVTDFDYRYWSADRVDRRLMEINRDVNSFEYKIQETVMEKEILDKKIKELKKKVSEYPFLVNVSLKLDEVRDFCLKDKVKLIEKIESEIKSKIEIYNTVKKTKALLKRSIEEIRKNINRYSFLEEFNHDLLKAEEKLSSLKELDVEGLEILKKELENLKRKIEKKEKAVLNGSEAVKNYKILQEGINEIDSVINRLNIVSESELKQKELKTVYDKYIEKLRVFSVEEVEKMENLKVSLENKILNLKIVYQKEKEKYIISKKLEEIKEKYKDDFIFFEEFGEKMQNIRTQTQLFDFLYEVDEYESRKKYIKKQIEKLKEKLEKSGYKFEEEPEISKTGYIKTNKSEYKVKYVFHDNGEIGFNFVRIVNGEELDEYERKKTVEMAKKWCSDFDKINEELKKEGYELEISLREEPNMEDIIFEELEEEEDYDIKTLSGYVEE